LPQVHAELDFDKASWSLKVNKTRSDYIDATDGVDVTLTIGDYQASENLSLHNKNPRFDRFKYQRKPKLDCRQNKGGRDEHDGDDRYHRDDKDDREHKDDRDDRHQKDGKDGKKANDRDHRDKDRR
jgi:hypothetical protein